jgi:hypothetical protein
MKTYLSGGIEYADKFGRGWRDDLESWLIDQLHHEVFNPTKESITFFEKNFPGFKRSNLKQESENKIRLIIGQLIHFECNEIIKNCNYVICYWDESCHKGAGTQGELTLAKFHNIPIFIVTLKNLTDLPAWIIGCSTRIFNDFDNLKSFLKEKFLNNCWS